MVKKIAVGQTHTMALMYDGSVYVCGDNTLGALGLGDNVSRSTFTKMIGEGSSGVTDIAAGRQCSYISKNGVLYSCGYNGFGNLGHGVGPDTNVLTPMLGAGTGGNTSIVASSYSIYAINDGAIYACGMNSYGGLGDGTTTNRSVLVKAIGIGSSGVDEVAVCQDNSACIRKGDAAYSVGYNVNGQLGIGNTTDQHQFVPMIGEGLSGVDSLWTSRSYRASYVVKSGKAYSCGRNINGCLGLGNWLSGPYVLTPMIGAGTSNVLKIAVGNGSMYAIKTGGVLYACGRGTEGQLCNGVFNDSSNQLIPTIGEGTADISDIASIGIGVIASKKNKLFGAGSNSSNALGIVPPAAMYNVLTSCNSMP